MTTTAQNQNEIHNLESIEKERGSAAQDFSTATNGVSGAAVRKPYDYGGNPLARIDTSDSARLGAFGGALQPGLYKAPVNKGIANPAPLGLSAFALTTFVLSLVNLGSNGLTEPNIVVGAAFAYGGLVQLLAGMWEMAVGNTFGATALSSYGGFWIGTAIILTPGGFQIMSQLDNQFTASFGLYLIGWFIFTFLLLILTLKSTVAFFTLFFTLDLAFLMLGIAYLYAEGGVANLACLRAGGAFGIIAAFAAWYNALAGMADANNSFFIIPVAHFPWSAKGRERRGKTNPEDSANV